MSLTSVIAELLSNPAWMAALYMWRENDSRPQPVGAPALGLSLSDWKTLQDKLLASGYFTVNGDMLTPGKEGRAFLVSLSEIYRGEQRLPLYGRVMDYLQQAQRGAAADIGCGAGYMLRHLALLGYEPLYGYDLLPISLQIAQAGVESAGKTAALYAHDATSLSEIGDGSLAVLFSRGALSYFDIVRFADSIRRVMAPHGWVILEVVGLSYYLQPRHFLDLRPRHWRKTMSISLVIARTLLFELFGIQLRMGAKTPEIGLTKRTLRRFADRAGLTIKEITPAPTTTGYFVALQQES